MIKLMIVDDEALVLDWLSQTFDWEAQGIHLVATADNGQAALDEIPRVQPDILLADICMPVMNGLELIEQVKDRYPLMEVIILSGIKEFEYAHTALNLGVKNYILKPCSNDEVLTVVNKARDGIMEKRKQQQYQFAMKDQIGRALPILKGKAVLDLICGKKITSEKLKEYSSIMDMDLVDGAFQLLVAKNDGISASSHTGASENDPTLPGHLADLFHQILEGEQIRFGLANKYDDKIVVLFQSNEVSTASSLPSRLTAMGTKIIEKCIKHLGYSVTIGISASHKGWQGIPDGFREADKALQNRVYEGKGKVYLYENLSPVNTPVVNDLENQKDHLLRSAVSGNTELAIKHLDAIKTQLIKNRGLSLKGLQEFCIEIIVGMYESIKNMGIAVQKPTQNLNCILEYETLDELVDYTWCTILEMTHTLRDLSVSSSKQAIDLAILYMQDNIKEDISLEEVSDYIGLSTNYFSEVFKKETGITFIEYLTRLRVDKAKQLLANQGLKMYEIAEMVGYRDSRYFSQVFRKYESVTPSEYRKTLANM